MKIICLNIWGGKRYRSLMAFLRKQAKTTDVFCLQELFRSPSKTKLVNGFRSGIFYDVEKALSGFDVYFVPMKKGLDFYKNAKPDLELGQAIFVRNGLKIISHGSKIVHHGDGADPKLWKRTVQYIKLQNETPLIVFNFHGIATWPKTDTPQRLSQSKNLRKFITGFSGRKVLCGDFNIDASTRSIKIIDKGMKNLVKDFHTFSTRPEELKFDDRISDYMIVSKDIKIKSFAVPELYVSDHLPLILEFD